MTIRRLRKTAAFVLGILPVTLCAFQPPALIYHSGQFPAPRYPKLPANISVDDLMPVARTIVTKDRANTGLQALPGYGIKPGDRVLFVVAPDQDQRVLDALRRAIQEAGGKADVLTGNDRPPRAESVAEFTVELNFEDFNLVSSGAIPFEKQVALATAGGYNFLVSSEAGNFATAELQGKIATGILPWAFADQMMTAAKTLPPSLLKIIDDITWADMQKAVAFHASDPEGTDISWINTAADWATNRIAGHLNIRGENRFRGNTKPGSPGANGVIAGTWSHTGPGAYVRVIIKNDHVERIEGSGPYADTWRAMAEKYQRVDWPGKQGPGLFAWLFEAALGTNPAQFRPKDALQRVTGNWNERLRSGVVHWGIGAGTTDASGWTTPRGDTQAAQFYRDHPETPSGHVHLHNYFLTVEITLQDGSKKLLIDKGRLTALDDVRVRHEAAKYGNPDELLREQWIPAVPGINVPGDYFRDYAKDPAAYIQRTNTR